MVFKKIKGVHIDGRKHMSCDAPIKDYLNPNFVYIPLVTGNVIYKSVVQANNHVLKGQIIANREGRFNHPVCSPVSGTIMGSKKMWHSSGRMVEMLEIANDFKEEAVADFGKKDERELNKEVIVEKMQAAGIVGLGGAGFPTFVKYLGNNTPEVLIINAAECEPYITADYALILSEADKLVRGIHYMMLASGAPKARIAIKKNKKPAIAALNEAVKNYPGVEVFLMKDVYPAGWEKYIVQKVVGKDYDGLPSSVGAIVNNVQTAIAVCEAVEENKPLIEKVVTFTGEGLKNPQNVRVKIGTLTSDVLEMIGGYKDDLGDSYFIAGGPMTGNSIMFDNLVISHSLGSVIVKPKVEHVNNPSCMGCGKCASHCPAFLTPTAIKAAYISNDIELLKQLNVTKCVQCGLCSYVCPSRVEITEFVGKAKDAVMKAAALKK